MSDTRSHEDLRGALAAEALGVLDGDGRAELLAHLGACPACRAELAELHETAAALAYAAPPAPLDAERSARIRARLLARAAADTRGAAVIPLLRGAAPARGGWWAAAAAMTLLAGAGGYALTQQGRVDRLSARLAALEAERAALRGEVASRERTLSELADRRVRVIELASSDPRAPSGRMFWNPASGAWTFFAHGLPPVDRDRAYQLWLITPGRKLNAGTFTPGPDGTAVVQTRYDLPTDSLRAVAVTEEPAGGVPAPTGNPVVVGEYSG